MIRKLKHLHINLSYLSVLALLLLLSSVVQVRGQAAIGARELSLGQASTALRGTAWSMFSNPAMMPSEDKTASFFGVRYYGLSELTDMAVSVTYPTNIGVFGAGAHRYGYSKFSENRIRLGYKNSFMGFHFGAIVNYNHVAMGGGYGSAGAVGVDVGLAAPILSNLWIGAKATNINQPHYGSLNDEALPRDLSIGISYQLSDIALFTSEVYKDVEFPISYRGGVEVQIVGQLVGRAGVTTEPQTFSAGFGYSGSSWGANIAVQRHENRALGYSPAVDFKINW